MVINCHQIPLSDSQRTEMLKSSWNKYSKPSEKIHYENWCLRQNKCEICQCLMFVYSFLTKMHWFLKGVFQNEIRKLHFLPRKRCLFNIHSLKYFKRTFVYKYACFVLFKTQKSISQIKDQRHQNEHTNFVIKHDIYLLTFPLTILYI